MKKIKTLLVALLVVALSFPLGINAQVKEWTVQQNTYLKPTISSWQVQIPNLATSTETKYVIVNASGTLRLASIPSITGTANEVMFFGSSGAPTSTPFFTVDSSGNVYLAGYLRLGGNVQNSGGQDIVTPSGLGLINPATGQVRFAWGTGKMSDDSAAESADFQARTLTDSSARPSADWTNRQFFDENGIQSFTWGTNRALVDAANSTAISFVDASRINFPQYADGLLKVRSGEVQTATNGSDYTLIATATCGAGSHVVGVDASGNVTCSADSTGTNYFTLSGNSLYPTSTAYLFAVGTTTPNSPFIVATGTVVAHKIQNNGQNIFGAASHSNTTSTAFAIVNSSSTATGFTLYQQTPTGGQDIFTICRGAVTSNCQQRIFSIDQYGGGRFGQTNSTGQLTVDANGNFTQIIQFYNSNANGATLLNVGGLQGGTLRLSASTAADLSNSPAWSISQASGIRPVFQINTGGTGTFPFLTQAAGGVGYANTYKARDFYGAGNTNIGGTSGNNPSTDSLTVENGNILVYDANSSGGGLGAETLASTTITSSTWSRSGIATINATSGAVFAGAGTGYIQQATGTMALQIKPNTQYQLQYTVAGTNLTCYSFINDPSQLATTSVPASIQSADTSWRKFGSTNYSAMNTPGTSTFFFRTAEGGMPKNFVLGVFCPSGSTVTMSNISLKEARGGFLKTGSGGGLIVGSMPSSTAYKEPGVTVYASSSDSSSYNLQLFDSNATSTFRVRADGRLSMKDGTNRAMGSSTLVSGSSTVSNTLVSSSTRIFLTTGDCSADVGTPYISSRSSGVSFTISSTNASSSCPVNWLLIEPE